MDFPTVQFKPRKDRYAKTRGGPSKFLYIACGNCAAPVMVYQKDGPGGLVRCYADRIVWPAELVEAQVRFLPEVTKPASALSCPKCAQIIAGPMIYEPENRPAYRLIPGTFHAYRSAERARARVG